MGTSVTPDMWELFVLQAKNQFVLMQVFYFTSIAPSQYDDVYNRQAGS